MTDDRRTIERSYRFHLWGMALGLAFYTSLAVGMTLGLAHPELKTALFFVPVAVFTFASAALGIAIRGRRVPGTSPPDQGILGDEWVGTNINRARKIALRTVWLAQGPLMFIVAYVPSDPSVGTSVGGMAGLTISLAGTAFCGSYLLYSRDAGHE